MSTIGPQAIRQFYFEAYETMRNITGIGAGNGPFMVIHDGFIGLETWNGFLEGSDRLSLESHYYFAFSPDSYETNFYNMVTRPCQWWAPGFNQSTLDNGLTIGGEWSIAPNDCGLWLNAVGEGSYFDGSHSNSNGRSYGSCTQYTDVRTFSDTFKEQLRAFTLANMDTFRESIRHEVVEEVWLILPPLRRKLHVLECVPHPRPGFSLLRHAANILTSCRSQPGRHRAT